MVVLTGRQRCMDLCEFQSNSMYIESYRSARTIVSEILSRRRKWRRKRRENDSEIKMVD